MNDDKLDTQAQTQLELAAAEHISYINSYIRDGICTVFTTGTSREEVLRCVSHLLAQIILESNLSSEDGASMLRLALEYIADTSFAILVEAAGAEESFN